jgi:hypothetical protein
VQTITGVQVMTATLAGDSTVPKRDIYPDGVDNVKEQRRRMITDPSVGA